MKSAGSNLATSIQEVVSSNVATSNMKNWQVYLVQCSDGSLYCGATNNVQKRVATHNIGKGAKYTKTRRPVILLATSKQMSKSDALGKK